MNINELQEEATNKMNSGDFEGALRLTRKIQSLGTHHLVSYFASALLIDIGAALHKEEIIKEGVDLLLKDFEKITKDAKFAPTAYYNLANGYSGLFNFRKAEDPHVACFNNKTELSEAKKSFRKALEYDPKDPTLTSQIFVNMGNCFDLLGRVVEALECYEEALKWKPDHGMALANKGVALYYYAGIAGEHQGTFLREAYSLINEGIKLGVSLESASSFKGKLKAIRASFSDSKVLDEPPKFPWCKVEADSEFEKSLIEFCLKNKLYLNVCNYCQKCNAAIGDQMVIQKMLIQLDKLKGKKPLEDDPFLHLSAYLNQIKQDYITARFILILSQYKRLNLDFVDRRVKIIDTLDYSIHNIYIQLVKTSFKSLYDILDKIACFINEYLELEIPEKEIDFRRVWYSNTKTKTVTKKKTVHKKIVDTKNYVLNALFEVHQDFENGPYKKLRDTRNALTHRFVNVRMFQKVENAENMTEQTLFGHTLELAKITRNAIIYLLHFVYIEESKKEAKTKGMTPPLIAQEIPDHLKSYR